MKDAELDLALEKYFKDEISERAKELEDCKDIAFKIWDKICEIHKDFSPRTMKLYISGLKIILEYNFQCKDFSIIFPSNHPDILKFVSIIAGHSDIKGKVFGQPNSLNFIFPYK